MHKGGSRSAPKNYRPVALTSHLIKVFERVVRHALVNHIEHLGLLPDGQHGSRAMRSTLTQLLAHWDNILDGLEQGAGVDCVYLDFSKAFDKVETGVLLHKLRDGKVLGKLGCWLAAFLDSSSRKQAVVVNGRISDLSLGRAKNDQVGFASLTRVFCHSMRSGKPKNTKRISER